MPSRPLMRKEPGVRGAGSGERAAVGAQVGAQVGTPRSREGSVLTKPGHLRSVPVGRELLPWMPAPPEPPWSRPEVPPLAGTAAHGKGETRGAAPPKAAPRARATSPALGTQRPGAISVSTATC